MRASTIYRALLRCYPAAFRDEYGQQMQLTFDEQLDEARQAGGARHVHLWMQAAADACTIAPKEHWHVLAQDLRYACRAMAAKPGFTFVAVLSLALGIGANTAIFSLWNGVLNAPLPGVRRPDQLVMLSDPNGSGSWVGGWDGRSDGPRAWLTYTEFEELRDHADRFAGLMASQSSLPTWTIRVDGAADEEARGRFVSGGFFDLLGASPAIGRLFTTDADRVAAPEIVISYDYWRHRFDGDPAALGRTIAIRNVPLTIIGVTAAGFVGETNGQRPAFWLPLRMQPRVLPDRDRLHDIPPDKSMWLHVFGRLNPGVTLAQAETQANAIFHADLASFYGSLPADRRQEQLDQQLRLQPAARGASPVRRQFATSLMILLGSVGVLLLIACANLANLLLARAVSRKTEIAVRLSLGANRGRLVRQLITESLALAGIGGVMALFVAGVFHGALVRMMTRSDPRFDLTFRVDPLVLLFAIGVTLAAVVLFGVLPAWQATRTDAGAALKEQGRSSSGSRRQTRSGRVLVGAQLALSLPLLVGAGLLGRTVYNLQHADLGFPAERMSLVRVDFREAFDNAARRDAARATLLDELRRIHGVRSVSYSQLGIFSNGESSGAVMVEGYVPKSDRDRPSLRDIVGPGYFSTLGVPVKAGREIGERDKANAPKVCVINDALAARFFENRNPIGMHLTTLAEDGRESYEIVGVVGYARTHDVREPLLPRYYLSAAQLAASPASPTYLIRSTTDPAPLLAAARETVRRMNPSLPILLASTVEEEMDPLIAQDTISAQLALAFASVALALAAIGLYGVLSYGVTRRTGEIAIRVALGAEPRRVRSLILRETLGVLFVGLLAGGALAYAASRVIGSRLYGVAPQDPVTLGFATGLLLIVALAAAFFPARRAARLDPIVALRQQV